MKDTRFHWFLFKLKSKLTFQSEVISRKINERQQQDDGDNDILVADKQLQRKRV